MIFEFSDLRIFEFETFAHHRDTEALRLIGLESSVSL
jgi:hypothetical protein